MAESFSYDSSPFLSPHPAFRLLYVSPISVRSNLIGPSHAHDCVEIFFIMHGTGGFVIRNERISVKQNDFVIVNPSVEHTETVERPSIMDYIVIGLEGAAFLLKNQSQGYYAGSFAKYQGLFRELLTALSREATSREARYQTLCNDLIDILLIYIGRIAGLKIIENEGRDQARLGTHRILWVKQYLDDNFTRSVNLDDIAAMVNLNKYGIIRLFKQLYGVSPMRYMLDRRYEEACFYLKTSSVSIKQIAELSGFSSSNYFSQMFQRREGVSPTEYRRLHQQAEDMENRP